MDLGITNKRGFEFVKDCRSVFNRYTVSDHKLVKIKLIISCSKPKKNYKRQVVFNSSQLCQETIQQNYKNLLQQLVNPSDSFSRKTGQVWTSAATCCPKNKTFKGWFEDSKSTLLPIIQAKTTSYQIYKNNPT